MLHGSVKDMRSAQMSLRSFWMPHSVSALFLSWATSSSVRVMLTTLATPVLFSTHGRDRKTSSPIPYMLCRNIHMHTALGGLPGNPLNLTKKKTKQYKYIYSGCCVDDCIMLEARVSDCCRGWTAERINTTLGSV